jgi:sucrose phosphorylase
MGSIHLLPLYPSTGDRGFAPITYQQVDPEFGENGYQGASARCIAIFSFVYLQLLAC